MCRLSERVTRMILSKNRWMAALGGGHKPFRIMR